MPALIIIGIGYAGLCAFATAAFVLAGRADDATDQALGDWPNLPEGIKTATRANSSGGGRSGKARAAVNAQDNIARRHGEGL